MWNNWFCQFLFIWLIAFWGILLQTILIIIIVITLVFKVTITRSVISLHSLSDFILTTAFEVWSLSPVSRWENQGLKRSDYVPTVVQLVSDRAGISSTELQNYLKLLTTRGQLTFCCWLTHLGALVNEKVRDEGEEENLSSDRYIDIFWENLEELHKKWQRFHENRWSLCFIEKSSV